MRKLVVLMLTFGAAVFAQCGPNGQFYGVTRDGQILCTGKTGKAAYSQTFSSVTTVTITAATHGQGLTPVGICYDNGTPKSQIALTAGYPQVAANGDITFAWTGSKSGTCLVSAWGSVKGDQGPTGTAGAQGPPGATGPSGGLTHATIRYVSSSGSDSNDGLTWNTSLATVAAAVASLPLTGSGVSIHYGTVMVGPGVYTETATPIPFNAQINLTCTSAGDGSFSGAGSVIKLADGRNTALFAYTSAFATGDGYAHFLQVNGCTFDGNAANNPTAPDMIQLYNGGFQNVFTNVSFRNAKAYALHLQNHAVNFSCYTCTFSTNGGALYVDDVVGGNVVTFVDTQIDDSGVDPIKIVKEDTDTGGSNVFTFTGLKAEANNGSTTHTHIIWTNPNSAGSHPMQITVNGLTTSNQVGSGTYAVYEAAGGGAGAMFNLRGVNAAGYTGAFISAKTGDFTGQEVMSYSSSDTSTDRAPAVGFGKGGIFYGNGTPEGAVAAQTGALFVRQDGTRANTIYVKEQGTSTTGWTPYGPGFKGKGTYTNMLAASPSVDDVWVLTDSSTVGGCSAGSGTYRVFCVWTGTAWSPMSGGGGGGSTPANTMTWNSIIMTWNGQIMTYN